MKKTMNKIYPILMSVIIIVLIISFIYVNQLKSELNDKKIKIIELEEQKIQFEQEQLNQEAKIKEIEEKYNELKIIKNNINQSLNDLKSSYNQLEKEKEQIDREYSDLSETYTEEFSTLMGQLNDFEEKIQSSIDWFRDNRDIKDFKQYRDVKLDLYSDCLEYDENSCDIRLQCIPFINSHKYDVIYKLDEQSVNKTDFLLDLDQIWLNKGGDCEDISLLFTAEYNYLVDRCEMLGYSRNQIRLFSFFPSQGHNSFITFQNQYYYIDTEPTEVTSGENYVYPVCGRFPGAPYGHCVVAITKEKIKGTNDIYEKLKDAILIEPQKGNLIANVGDTGSLIIYDSNKQIKSVHFISVVMTEDDIKYFYTYTGDNVWKGYTDFSSEIKTQKDELRKLWIK